MLCNLSLRQDTSTDSALEIIMSKDNRIDLTGLTERDKQGLLQVELRSLCKRFRMEYEISRGSFIGVVEMFKSECLEDWYREDNEQEED